MISFSFPVSVKMFFLIVGSSGSGKRSFLTRLSTGAFPGNPDINSCVYKSDIFFLNERKFVPDGILVFTDATSCESMIESCDICKKYYGRGTPVFAVINKTDMCSGECQFEFLANQTFEISVKSEYQMHVMIDEIKTFLLMRDWDSMIDFSENIESLTDVVEFFIEFMYVHPVTLELVFQELTEEFDSSGFDEPLCKFIEGKEIGWDTRILPGHHLVVFCESSFNNSRKGGCGVLCIPKSDFHWEKVCKRGITVKDLTEAVYRMKGSKYDTWHEHLEEIRPMKIEDQEDGYTFMVIFNNKC